MRRAAVFAIPGDIDRRTGGYIYEKELLLALRRAGREVAHLALPGSYPRPTPEDLRVTGDALAAIAPGTPVLLDGFLPGATEPAVLARLRAPFVAVTHHPLALETGLDPARAAELHRIERANLGRAAQVIVPSPHTARTLARDYAVPEGRITVIPPGTQLPDREIGTGSMASGDILILSVGQLVPRKGHDTLLRALARIRDLPWRAVIAGDAADPDHAGALARICAAQGLETRVAFAGPVAPDALARLYSEAAIFALATRYEGYGMVFAEALAHGLPIVAGAGGAVPDTVPAGAGRLVAPDDEEGFADALRDLVEKPAERARLAAAARDFGARLPSWDDAARIAGAVLDRLAQ